MSLACLMSTVVLEIAQNERLGSWQQVRRVSNTSFASRYSQSVKLQYSFVSNISKIIDESSWFFACKSNKISKSWPEFIIAGLKDTMKKREKKSFADISKIILYSFQIIFKSVINFFKSLCWKTRYELFVCSRISVNRIYFWGIWEKEVAMALTLVALEKLEQFSSTY